MFAVIYRFKLKPTQEKQYIKCWNEIANYFSTERGAVGSCLHKGEDGLWVAYSRWPDRQTRDASWPIGEGINQSLPPHIQDAIQYMVEIKEHNSSLQQYDEICLDVVEDKLLGVK
ncbi:MAG: hypothetical protein CMF48_06955 [Legionellales bacterium]|nr:hypothetical protein [Legionellales bacterium]|tara:strand:+ start:77 stop:421 length:345 start_codon:yes stop_codon:yes gene_type:complete